MELNVVQSEYCGQSVSSVLWGRERRDGSGEYGKDYSK